MQCVYQFYENKGYEFFLFISLLEPIDIGRITSTRDLEQSNLEDEEISVKTIAVATVK